MDNQQKTGLKPIFSCTLLAFIIFGLNFVFANSSQLSHFGGEVTENGVKLTWVTESEKENQGFIIQRKIDSEDNWLEIADFITNSGLRGQGSVSYQTNYEYIDSSVLSGHIYQYRLGDVDYNKAIRYHTNLSFSIEVTLTAIPEKFSLNAAYPNPFNPITTITYNIPESVNVKLYIYNVNGNLVKKLINNVESPGIKKISWNGKNDQGIDVPSGMYIYTFQATNFKRSKKILLIR